MYSLPFPDIWNIRDENGQSILYTSVRNRDGDNIEFFCNELRRHKFMSGKITYWKIEDGEVALEKYRNTKTEVIGVK